MTTLAHLTSFDLPSLVLAFVAGSLCGAAGVYAWARCR